MKVIKLKDLLRESNIIKTEDVGDIQPADVKFVTPPAHHAYAKAASDGAGKPYIQPNIDFGQVKHASDSTLVPKIVNVIKRFENSMTNPRGGYNNKVKKWFPHKSLEGGSDTIAYGHKIQKGEDYRRGITDDEATQLLEKDVNKKIDLAKQHIKNFDSLPMTVKIATINALFRGDMGPKTMQLLAQSRFDDAAKEYLNHREYRSTSNRGVKKRMEWNAEVIRGAA